MAEVSVNIGKARKEGSVLSKREQDCLTGELTDEDISAIERQIKRKLDHRGKNWSTLTEKTRVGPVTVVLVGLDGAGKSSLGNLLSGKEDFGTSMGANRGTVECKISSTDFRGRPFRLVDTPAGVTWDDLAKISQGDEIHVFILVMNASGFRTREQEIQNLRVFNDGNKDHWMVVATHSTLSYAHGSVETFIEDVSTIPDIKRFLEMTQKRVVLVDCGTGKMSPDLALDGNMTFDKEREQARTMVFEMVNEVLNTKGIDPQIEGAIINERPSKKEEKKRFKFSK